MKHTKNEIYYSEIYDIPIELILPNPNTPRSRFDSLKMNELIRTVKEYGIIQPVTVRQKGDMYELISGERRVRAAIGAGLDMVPVIIVDADDDTSAVMTLLENLQREDLCFFEIAEGYKNLIRNQGLTQDEFAKKIGISRAAVANKMRLLRLPSRVQRLVRDFLLSERHARALLALSDEDLQMSVVKHIHKDNLSATDTEKLIEDILTKHPEKQSDVGNGDVRVFSNTVSRALDYIKETGVDAEMTSETHDWGSRFVIDLKKAAD